jgi:uncharacterized cupin superfamily protein
MSSSDIPIPTTGKKKKEDAPSSMVIPFPLPVAATNIPPGTTNSSYPAVFQSVVVNRTKRKLGDVFGLTNFGVNHTTLDPAGSAASALLQHHHQELQDEFVYIVKGQATFHFGDEERLMQAGDCMGFPKGQGIGHALRNHGSTEPVEYLEIGDRTFGDTVDYPQVDLKYFQGADGKRFFTHKDGTPYI